MASGGVGRSRVGWVELAFGGLSVGLLRSALGFCVWRVLSVVGCLLSVVCWCWGSPKFRFSNPNRQIYGVRVFMLITRITSVNKQTSC